MIVNLYSILLNGDCESEKDMDIVKFESLLLIEGC